MAIYGTGDHDYNYPEFMTVLLDIEGTVCPISFVKECMFPYFLNNYAAYLTDLEFPLNKSQNSLAQTLGGFPAEITATLALLKAHLDDLVAKDIKDPVLKAFQGIVWQQGFEKGDLKAPLYCDAISFICATPDVYIYSSGSVAAQKLLFGHVEVAGALVDLTPKLKGYYDITTAGFKHEKTSYQKIASDIGCASGEVTFYSDNVQEVKAALEAGMKSKVVVRPGNAPLSSEDEEQYQCISTFEQESDV